jgi:hypothetical protein
MHYLYLVLALECAYSGLRFQLEEDVNLAQTSAKNDRFYDILTTTDHPAENRSVL